MIAINAQRCRCHGNRREWTSYVWLDDDDRDIASASTATYGLRWTGTQPQGELIRGWTAKLARQRDHADNPLAFSRSCWLLEASLQTHGITYKLSREHLGGNGRHALQTPLATLHAFNGWADKFLVTLARGEALRCAVSAIQVAYVLDW